MSTLFISDLHLSAERPAITALFLDFLRHRARQAEALYILGDLFEYWIGDDVANQPEVRPLIAAVHELTGSGVPVYVMHGNRDFLLGPGFEQATGCRLLPDPTVIGLYGEQVLLMHGDTLCTDDTDYLKFRAMVRNPQWVQQFLGKPVAERINMVREYREVSKTATAAKKPEIMDVNAGAVAAAFQSHGVHHLIHGHTHRPAQHTLSLNGQTVHRTVLGDWYEQGSVLVCDVDGCVLETLH
ncbi:MAG TPA: UDP-2,3-diacylglucosamine diphosphatase [Gammaproteobacteria bacterium]|nr:UDP-2,3-diacylglucosamine diphosphatase [Gammaproteobacteria bacterium]